MSASADIIITGGKTGGHLFPGIAVAEAVLRLKEDAKLLFVGTNAPFEVKTLKQYNFDHKAIISRPIKGGNLLAKAGSVFVLILSMIQSLFLLARTRPGFVLGVGGFSSFSVVLAAWMLRIPTGIQEQNAMPGLTNRLLARFAGTIFTSFENTKALSERPNARFVGNPVRRMQQQTEDMTDTSDFSNEKFTILVTGGSQGATSINTAVVDALKLLKNKASHYNIIHQTGAKDEIQTQAAYQQMNISAKVQAFFNDMPQLQQKADLVISRAGAGTVFELCSAGKPAVLVPYPYAADDHQTMNAKSLEENQACILIPDTDLSGEILSQTIESLRTNPDQQSKMSRNIKALAMPDADRIIAEHILTIIEARG